MKKIRLNKQWLATLSICVIAIVMAMGIVYFQYRHDINNIALAGTGDNVRGQAWSSNIGWIVMNCLDDTNCAVDYGVRVDTGSGAFSGYAWSSNIGWINFGATGNTCSSAPTMNVSNGAVTGYAQIVSMGADGCIKLSDDTVPAWTGNGVKFNSGTGEFTGYAWNANSNGSGIGWVSFNCSNGASCGSVSYKVSLGSAPAAPTLRDVVQSVDAADPCKTVTVRWYDNSSDEQGFVVEKSLDNSAWSDFCLATPTAQNATQCINTLSASTLYYFRVKAKGAVQDSAYVSTSTTTGYCAPALANSDVLSGSANCERINLTWSQAGMGSGVNHYEVWRSVNGGAFALLTGADNINPTTFTYSDTGIDAEDGSKYSYYIKAQNSGLNSNTIGPISPCPKSPKWKETGSQ